jgi:hypothetical protein
MQGGIHQRVNQIALSQGMGDKTQNRPQTGAENSTVASVLFLSRALNGDKGDKVTSKIQNFFL